MPKRLAVAIVFVLLVRAAPIAHQPSALRQTSRVAADTMVPDAPDNITLLTSATPYLAANAAQRVLTAAGVRFGLEVPAVDPTVPPIDLARLNDAAIPLGGRSLRDALNAIAKAVPAIRWSEADGVIVVRSLPDGDGVLDRRVSFYAVNDAAPRVALETLLQAIDPARPRGAGITGFGRPGVGAMNAGAASPAAGRNVTVSLANTTVRDVLQAIARLDGALSWTIRYDASPAGPDTASYLFTEGGETVSASSPYAQRSMQAGPGAPGGFAGPTAAAGAAIPISAEVSQMLLTYAARMHVRVSVEEVPSTRTSSLLLMMSPTTQGLPPLDLTGLTTAQAITRIVSLDSRYEWTESQGRFLVRPKAGSPGRLTLLDAPIGTFSASTEPARSVIDRIMAHVGMLPPGPSRPVGPPGRPSPIAIAMEAPINITLPNGATIRDALDAVSDATGWFWAVLPRVTPGTPSLLEVEWRGATWTMSTNVRLTEDLSPAPVATHVPSHPVPASLDRTIGRVSLDSSRPGAAGLIDVLGRAARTPMGIEALPPAPASADPRVLTRGEPPLVVGPGKFSDALYVLLERAPEYRILSTDGIISVAPASLADNPAYFMNRPIDRFLVRDEGLYHAIGNLRHAVDPTYEAKDWIGAGAETMNRPVALSVTGATPRAILNQLVVQHGGMSWVSIFEGASASTPSKPEPEPANWALILVPIDGSGVAVRMGSLRDAASSSEPAPQPATPRPMGMAPTMDLPATPEGARSALMLLGRVARQPLGGEFVIASASPLQPASRYYDLSGLSLMDALDRITSLLPGYVVTTARDVTHLQPKALAEDPASWLNQKIARVDRHFDSLLDAQHFVASLPGRPAPAGAPPGAMPPPGIGRAGSPVGPTGPSPSLAARLVASITLSLTDVTIRDVLDEIARQRGAMIWFVEHRTMSSGAATITLNFSGYDGWSTSTSVR